MPGPCNSKKGKKKKGKGKSKTKQNAPKGAEQTILEHEPRPDPAILTNEKDNEVDKEETLVTIASPSGLSDTNHASTEPNSVTDPEKIKESHLLYSQSKDTKSAISAVSALDTPFITDGGDGPRVKNTELFLASFFCPPSSDNDYNKRYDREEILAVLKSVLTEELALTIWFNKTREYHRICPACQRLYRLGDPLPDPINGVLIRVDDPTTPPQALREQQLSGICSMFCFLITCHSSHPYAMEIFSKSWGHLLPEIDVWTRSLIDATDPQTAALMKYGISSWTPAQEENDLMQLTSERALGRIMRMTRRDDLGLGEVFLALAWYEEEQLKIVTTQSN